MAADAVVCLVTAPPERAREIANAIVGERLAACVNVLPQAHSVYRWQGKVAHDDESLLIVKTTRAAVPALEAALTRLHPYDTFELVALDIAAGAAPYLAWIHDSVDVG